MPLADSLIDISRETIVKQVLACTKHFFTEAGLDRSKVVFWRSNHDDEFVRGYGFQSYTKRMSMAALDLLKKIGFSIEIHAPAVDATDYKIEVSWEFTSPVELADVDVRLHSRTAAVVKRHQINSKKRRQAARLTEIKQMFTEAMTHAARDGATNVRITSNALCLLTPDARDWLRSEMVQIRLYDDDDNRRSDFILDAIDPVEHVDCSARLLQCEKCFRDEPDDRCSIVIDSKRVCTLIVGGACSFCVDAKDTWPLPRFLQMTRQHTYGKQQQDCCRIEKAHSGYYVLDWSRAAGTKRSTQTSSSSSKRQKRAEKTHD